MAEQVNLSLVDELRQYGSVNVNECFNCGNCTAICPLTTDATPFPRNNIRMLQLGLRDRLLQSPDPWLCYYCGECSATCPRQAEPAELQMAMRRWLTAHYDWTGLSRRFYTSPAWALGTVAGIFGLVVLLFALLHGPIVTDRVELNTFASVELIHIGDLILGASLAFFLVSSIYRMYSFIMRDVKAPLKLYITEAWALIYHFVTQERFQQCEEQRPWLMHLILASGWLMAFVVIFGFLSWFQTDEIYPITHPQRWLGYYFTAALVVGSGWALWGRITKHYHLHKFSELSDWLFPSLLMLTAVSGIAVHILRYMQLPLPTYYTYVAHVGIAAAMVVVMEVPFGKLAHFPYRLLAIYFQNIKEKALELQDEQAAKAA